MNEISRVTRSHVQARANYNSLSHWYDFIEGGWENGPRRLGLELLQVRPDARLLEIGVGTGSSLLELPDQVRAFGIDLSPGMLLLARSRLAKAGKPVKVVNGDAICLPFPNGYFDLAFMAFTLDLMDTPEIPAVLGEIRRVLQPGGRVAVVSSSKLGGTDFMARLYEWSHARFPTVVDCRPIYARRAVEDACFTVVNYRLLSTTGLGVEVVIGKVD
jgi:ubiquinone/menaquinone biosynthesis C-methylase UbiE